MVGVGTRCQQSTAGSRPLQPLRDTRSFRTCRFLSLCRVQSELLATRFPALVLSAHSGVLPLMQLLYAAKRGFYLVAPKPGAQQRGDGGAAGQLPPGFIQVEAGRSRATVSCTTPALNALNARLKDAASDCLILTQQVRHCSGVPCLL